MIVYIAGPMTGLPQFNYPAFNAAEHDLRAAGYDVLNPVQGEEPPAGAEAKPWNWYMRRALGQVIEADGIALLPGWEASKGATLEHHVGQALRMPVLPLAVWLRGEVTA